MKFFWFLTAAPAVLLLSPIGADLLSITMISVMMFGYGGLALVYMLYWYPTGWLVAATAAGSFGLAKRKGAPRWLAALIASFVVVALVLGGPWTARELRRVKAEGLVAGDRVGKPEYPVRTILIHRDSDRETNSGSRWCAQDDACIAELVSGRLQAVAETWSRSPFSQVTLLRQPYDRGCKNEFTAYDQASRLRLRMSSYCLASIATPEDFEPDLTVSFLDRSHRAGVQYWQVVATTRQNTVVYQRSKGTWGDPYWFGAIVCCDLERFPFQAAPGWRTTVIPFPDKTQPQDGILDIAGLTMPDGSPPAPDIPLDRIDQILAKTVFSEEDAQLLTTFEELIALGSPGTPEIASYIAFLSHPSTTASSRNTARAVDAVLTADPASAATLAAAVLSKVELLLRTGRVPGHELWTGLNKATAVADPEALPAVLRLAPDKGFAPYEMWEVQLIAALIATGAAPSDYLVPFLARDPNDYRRSDNNLSGPETLDQAAAVARLICHHADTMSPYGENWLVWTARINGLFGAERLLDLEVTTGLRLGLGADEIMDRVKGFIVFWHMDDRQEADHIKASILSRRGQIPKPEDCDG